MNGKPSLLLVEDSKSFGSVLKRSAEEALGLEVKWVRNYADAAKLLEEDGQPMTVAILDLHLPDAPDGQIVDLVLSKNIPVIVITGEYREQLRADMMAKGVLDYFVKDNLSVVETLIHFTQRIFRNSHFNVLVVDDSRSARAMLYRFLKRYGFRVMDADSGQAAIDLFDKQRIHMLLTDYQMPGMDGFQLTRKIRSRFRRDEVCIIGLSSQNEPGMAIRFIKAGANDFLAKPFQNEELLYRVFQNIEILEHNLTLEDQIRERTAKIQENEAVLTTIMGSALDAIITTDGRGMVESVNPAAEALFGYSSSKLIGQNIADYIIPVELRQSHQEAMARRSSVGGTESEVKRRIEFPGLRADGTLIDLEISLTTISQHGQVHYAAFCHDITDRKQLLKSLKETLDVAESANRAKSEFLANMSHEIRSPMNAIIGMTELVLSSSLTDGQRNNLEIVQQSSHTLLELLNSILDLSKIEAGKLTLEKAPFDSRGQIENACITMAVKAHQKDIELFCRLSPQVPETLIGDSLRLKQVLINLISNAIKFTSAGEIVVDVAPVAEVVATSQQITLRCSVQDTGVGIPADKLALVFERFTQADGSTTRQYGGTGLGLTISRHLVGLMGGDIKVESEPGQGSRFTFTATLAIGCREDRDKDGGERQGGYPRQPLQGVHLLVVIGQQTGRLVVQEMLSSMGATVTEADSLAAAIRQLRQARDQKTHYDLLLLDHRLVMDLDADTELWGTLLESQPIPAAVLIPTNMDLKDLPAVGWLQQMATIKKPVRYFQTLKTLYALLGRAAVGEASPSAARLVRSQQRPLRILLVEDLVNNQKLATAILEPVGHTLTIANNGQEALDILQQNRFDLILMDLQMPVLGGIETVQQIRQRDKTQPDQPATPIIAVTARAAPAEQQICLDAGMNGYLRKPYRPDELLAAVAEIATAGQPAVATVIDRVRKPAGTVAPVLAAVKTDPDTLVAQKQLLLQEGEKHLETIRSAVARKSSLRSVQELIWLKNVASDIGAGRVAVRCMRVKGKIEMEEWPEAQEIFTELEREFQEVIKVLQQ
ncbi:MAG: response regulator [Magnetococcales bacterium]|nr:response regulator [Magnetococcales bacterium]